MNNKLQPVRGTKDIMPDDFRLHQHIIDTARKVGELYGFEGFSTPIFEFTDVFKRTLGDTSDVVNKEMYSFEDRGGESLTLRPEFTAGIARAFISNGMQQNLPLKLFSYGPIFRYERPQKGRQRQFHQINFEWLGTANYEADVQIIALANHILQELGITKYKLELNSLGDAESRQLYRTALVDYFSNFKNYLSEDSQMRLQNNPLRILDSKDSNDRRIIADAPKNFDYFTNEAKSFFAKVKEGLDLLKIDYCVNPHIVRGLDYYSHVVFEFIDNADELGAQNTILAGGRYDGLIEQMGGSPTPATGFAAGIERLALLATQPDNKITSVAILPEYKDSQNKEALAIINKLRKHNIKTELFSGGNFNKRMKKANKYGADVIVILRDNNQHEIKSDTIDGQAKIKQIREIINVL